MIAMSILELERLREKLTPKAVAVGFVCRYCWSMLATGEALAAHLDHCEPWHRTLADKPLP